MIICYENLYKSKRNSWKQNEQYFKFEDLTMPILSHELRQSGEGAISLEGCTEVFKSFPPSKVPCNDGLAVEFYKMFLASRIKIAATLTLEADFSFKS